MKIRLERPEDISTIGILTNEAFKTVSYGDGTEADIINAMRTDGSLSLSMVAEDADQIRGQVTVSPAKVGGANGWYGIGPIAVDKNHFKQGIGSAMMHATIGWAWGMGASGLVLAGNPDYYLRFGFENDCGLTYLEHAPKYIHRLTLHGPAATGEITFAPALQGA